MPSFTFAGKHELQNSTVCFRLFWLKLKTHSKPNFLVGVLCKGHWLKGIVTPRVQGNSHRCFDVHNEDGDLPESWPW